jgi:hypothetical protein
MPLKHYYRALRGVYARTVLNIRRANRLTLRTRPPVWSPKYLRIWGGAFRIMIQFMSVGTHHSDKQLAKAMDRGPEVPGLKFANRKPQKR